MVDLGFFLGLMEEREVVNMSQNTRQKKAFSLLRGNSPMNRPWVSLGLVRDSRGEINPILDRSNRFVLIRLQSQVKGIEVFLTMSGL